MVKPKSPDTRNRLIDATLDLVAARGFDGVSVGDIEAGAGLAPRSGALYEYFDSKLAVLANASIGVEAVARLLLAELDRERTIAHVIEREADRLPALRDRMSVGISDRGYRIASGFVERWAAEVGVTDIDADAVAVLVVGSLINLRRSTRPFGAPPLAIDDDRVVTAFVMLSTSLLDQYASA